MKEIKNLTRIFSLSIFLIIYGSTSLAVAGQETDWISEIALQEGVHPHLVYAVINQESDFRPSARSPKGAYGLMQLMPGTARRFKVNQFNMQENVRGGCRYLRYLLELFGERLDLALAAYNAGEGAVIKYGYQIPPFNETQNYVRKILNSLKIRFTSGRNQPAKRNVSNPKRTLPNSTSQEKVLEKEIFQRKTVSSFLY